MQRTVASHAFLSGRGVWALNFLGDCFVRIVAWDMACSHQFKTRAGNRDGPYAASPVPCGRLLDMFRHRASFTSHPKLDCKSSMLRCHKQHR